MNVRLVLVRTVVRDTQGKAIGTLNKEDFQLFDNGKPQLIKQFVVEQPSLPSAPAQDSVTSQRDTGSPATRALETTPRPLFSANSLRMGYASTVSSARLGSLEGFSSDQPNETETRYRTACGQGGRDLSGMSVHGVRPVRCGAGAGGLGISASPAIVSTGDHRQQDPG